MDPQGVSTIGFSIEVAGEDDPGAEVDGPSVKVAELFRVDLEVTDGTGVGGEPFLGDLVTEFERDRLWRGSDRTSVSSTLSVGNLAYAKGISVAGNSQVDIPINGQFTTFQADIGLAATDKPGAAISFQVWGDGTLLYSSPIMISTGDYAPITVDVTGRSTLSLRTVMFGTAGAAANIADWGAARVSDVPSGGENAITWQVSAGGNVFSTSSSSSFVLRPSGTGVYTIKATTSSGGSASTTINIGSPYPWSQTATAGTGKVTLNWSSMGSGVTYAIYRGLSFDPTALTLYKSGVTETQYVDTAVNAGTTYYYAIATISPDGTQGPLSWIRYATPTG